MPERIITTIPGAEFLINPISITQLPEKFRFDPSVGQGFLELRKSSESLASKKIEEENGLEVAGAIILDREGKLLVKHTNNGTARYVETTFFDLSRLPQVQVATILATYKPEKNTFILIPQDYVFPYSQTPNTVIEKGKKILGFVHVHPNGWPPSPIDLAAFLESRWQWTTQGIISKDTLFLFVKTKEAKNSRVSIAIEIENKIKDLSKKLGNQWYATTKALNEKCTEYGVGFYIGSITKNEFLKVK